MPERVAIGRAIVALSVIVLLLAALLGLVLVTSLSMVKTVTSTETTTVMPTRQADDLVGASFAQHLLSFTSGNVSAIVSHYERNANVTWTGRAFGLTGVYLGQGNITILLNVFLGKLVPTLAIGNATQAIMGNANGSVTVNSTFSFVGRGNIAGTVNGTVSAQDFYTYSTTAGAWKISQETWDFLTFNTQVPIGHT
jgi:hypothetical protein